jgi:titin
MTPPCCRFTFECRLQCDTASPRIEWFKDDMPLTSPDYLTAYRDGVCTLTIDETFAEDSAKYTCKASTNAGTAETTSQFKVRGTQLITFNFGYFLRYFTFFE